MGNTESKPPTVLAMSVDSDSDDNEDIPLSVIKQKSPLKSLKSLKTKPFSPGKSSKAKAAQTLMSKNFVTTTDKGKTSVAYQHPPIVTKLVKMMEADPKWKEDPEKAKKIKHMITHVAKIVNGY